MILNDNQRKVSQLLILGKDTDEIIKDTKLTRQTINRIKRELEEEYQKVFNYEKQINDKLIEASELESDVEILKNLFMKRRDKDD